jgi:chromosome segregation ATPase
MLKQRTAHGRRLDDIRRQIELYQSQRWKHQQIVDGAAGRQAHLEAEIQKRLDAVAAMSGEIADLPAVVHNSKGVIARLNDQIATLKKKREDAKTKQRKLEQLARVRRQIAELTKRS